MHRGAGPLIAALHELRVALVEQPLARGREADLEGYRSPIPIAGDESLLSLDDIAGAPAASTWSTSSSTSAAA